MLIYLKHVIIIWWREHKKLWPNFHEFLTAVAKRFQKNLLTQGRHKTRFPFITCFEFPRILNQNYLEESWYTTFISDKVFKSGSSKICGRQPLKAVFYKFYLVHSWILEFISSCWLRSFATFGAMKNNFHEAIAEWM